MSNLADKRILIFAPDLEQKVHRGIAFYAKALLRTFNELGGFNYLVTGAKKSKEDDLQQLVVQKQLEEPSRASGLKLLSKYFLNQLSKNSFIEVDRDPRIGYSERLSYLKDVHGFVNKRGIYEYSQNVQPRLTEQPYTFAVKGFNILFSTSPSNIRVLRNTKVIQTLHDILPLLRSDHPDAPEVFFRRVKNMIIHSDLIMSVSEASKRDLLTLFPQYEKYEEKIITTYQPVPLYEQELRLIEPTIETSVLKKFRLTSKNYLIFVSSLEKRKNVSKLIEAYLGIQDELGMPLVLVGAKDPDNTEIMDLLKSLDQKWIRYLGYVPTLEKLILLKNANSFIFPSLYEGFGIPPLEAMKMGCPVVTSNISSLPEVCRDAALYVDPNSSTSIAKAILEVVSNEELRQKLIYQGHKRAANFSYDAYKKRLQFALDRVLK